MESVNEPYRLIVEASGGDNSVALAHPDCLSWLNFFSGDFVHLYSKNKKTICIILQDYTVPKGTIAVSKVLQTNLQVRVGDIIYIHPVNIPNGLKIQVLPLESTIIGLTGNISQTFLKPYFQGNLRPVCTGDVFFVRGAMRAVEFKVISTCPDPFCAVTDETIVDTEGEPIQGETELTSISYDDIGDTKNLNQVREIIEISTIYSHYNIGPRLSLGTVLHGSSSEKTMIVRAVANEMKMSFFLVHEAGVSHLGRELCQIFTQAREHAPSIIFIPELDEILSADRGCVLFFLDELINQLDGLHERRQVFVMAGVKRYDSIHPSLCRPGRLDHALAIEGLDSLGRLDVLKIQTKNMKLAKDIDLTDISKRAQGYERSDLDNLCKEAILHCVNENMKFVELDEEGSIDVEVLDSMIVTNEHFNSALKASRLCFDSEIHVEFPQVSWEETGFPELRNEFIENIVACPWKENPLPFNGIIMYGPGSGKDLIARAVACECEANFISVKGSLLFTGRNVEDIFAKARQAPPCIIFFDQLDSCSYNVSRHIIQQMSSPSERNIIFTIAAITDLLALGVQSPLVEPGEFRKQIYISNGIFFYFFFDLVESDDLYG